MCRAGSTKDLVVEVLVHENRKEVHHVDIPVCVLKQRSIDVGNNHNIIHHLVQACRFKLRVWCGEVLLHNLGQQVQAKVPRVLQGIWDI